MDLFLVLQDGIPQLVSTVPLNTGTTAVRVLFCRCLFSYMDKFVLWPRARSQGKALLMLLIM